jgi:hypothetical protein
MVEDFRGLGKILVKKDSEFHRGGAEDAEVGKGFYEMPFFPLRTLRLCGEYSSLDPLVAAFRARPLR